MIKAIKFFVVLHAPHCIFVPLINLNNKIKNRNGTVNQHEKGVYSVYDGKSLIYTCRRSRLRRYFWGVLEQCTNLSKEYLIDKVHFQDNDILVDCGANNGEIGVWAQSKGLNYYAFEPEPLEAYCCDLNNYQGKEKTFRKGLWFEKTRLLWYSKPESADSSIIKMEETDNIKYIETTTLCDFFIEHNITNIRLFKLEAEGAEPEVLLGALGVLDKIDYIAVDCGYERGVDKNHTFMEVYNILKENKFEIVAAEFKRVVFLFKRRGAKK